MRFILYKNNLHTHNISLLLYNLATVLQWYGWRNVWMSELSIY